MRSRTILRSTIRRLALPVMSIAGGVYFAHHALYDPMGWRHARQLSRDIVQAEQKLQLEEAKTAEIQRRVDGLNGKSLDPDLLDERARQSLGLAKPDEIIIYKP